MPEPVAAGTKRKKPPTFQHLPVYRGMLHIFARKKKNNRIFIFIPAKTLKKAWVEKTKIKSKWKAQKRKEGLESAAKLDLPVYDGEVEESNAHRRLATNDKPDETFREDLATSPQPNPEAPKAQASHLHPSRAHIHPGISVRKNAPNTTNSEERRSKKRKLCRAEGDEAAATEPPSVRDLMKEAYSRSSLHTFKADPLKRHGQNSSGRGGRVRPELGRGQPNMKLRMNAMLAKIKQDYT